MINNKFLKTCWPILFVAALAVPTFATAASDGTVGNSSSGSMNVFINVGSEVRISSLSDYTNDNWDGAAYSFETKPFCVYSNSPQSKYTMNITGTGKQPKFELSNGTDTVPYSVEYQDLAANGYASVVGGQDLSDQVGSNDPECKGAPDARLKINVGTANGQAGKYTGTVNLMVTAQ